MQNTGQTSSSAPKTYSVTDLKGVIQFFDGARVKELSASLAPAAALKWPKAKEEDVLTMTQDAFWRVLDAGDSVDPYDPSNRADICDKVTKALSSEYSQRCRKRNAKRKERIQKKGLETDMSLFMNHVTLLAFVIYGDVRRGSGLLLA